MKESKFQIINQRLINVDYIINENFSKNGIELKLNSNIKIKRDDAKKIAEVIFTLYIFPDENIEDVPFKITVSNKGQFKWTDDIDSVTLDKLLNTNTPAILMSYMRSIVSQLTSFSSYPPLVLPLIDFTQVEK